MKRIKVILFLSTLFISHLSYGQSLTDADRLFQIGKYADAQKAYQTAIAKGINENEAQTKAIACKECIDLHNKAINAERAGKKDEVRIYYRQLLELNPADPEANEYLNANEKKGLSRYVKEVILDDQAIMKCYIDPNASDMSYLEAKAYCNQLNVGGETGWELPTMDDLLMYFDDYPSEKGTFIWVGPKGVIINGKQSDYYDQGRTRYAPCINGSQLVVYPYEVNSQEQLVSGDTKRHKVIPVKIVHR